MDGCVQPLAFHQLGNLQRLSIANCPLLRSIDASPLKGLFVLEDLDLSFNQLSTLGEDLVAWDRLKSLDLRGNRWSCDCQILSFLPTLLRSLEDQRVARDIYCALPESLSGVRVLDVKVHRGGV